MQESDPAAAFRAGQPARERQDVVDRLVFAALREQTRARQHQLPDSPHLHLRQR